MGNRMLLGAMGIGAGLMYLFDPRLGRRRRTLLYDKCVHFSKQFERGMDTTIRDLRQRSQGVIAETRSRIENANEEVPDHILIERVRARMGRFVSHPGAIEVTAQDGKVTLSGPILAHEVDDLLAVIPSVRGVREVENRLEPHVQRDISSLQGGRPRPGSRFDVLQINWSPATRLVMGTAGGLLMANCLARRTPGAMLLGTAGFAAFMRSAANVPLRQLFGLKPGRVIDVQKTIHINAPVERVFEYWTDYENFPQFMTHVREVRDLGGGRSRWTVEGPTGTRVHWTAVLTESQQNERLAWRTEPGSRVAHAGMVRFIPEGDNRTRIDVKMSYSPPAGVAGHLLATLLGCDPKHEMDDDLMRMKTFLETDTTPRDAASRSA